MKKLLSLAVVAFATMTPAIAWASEAAEEHGGESEGGHGVFALLFAILALLVILSKVGGLVEKFGQPAVLGELVIGVILGNLTLVGIHWFGWITGNEIIAFMAELGVVILLFQIGLESNLSEMKKVGVSAGLVAIIGVVLPFVLGTYVVGPWLLPGLSTTAYLFLGASLTATSVGITARVFKDLNKLKTTAAQTVLGAAVIDDILGLLILAVVSAIATTGSVSPADIGLISVKAIGFLVVAVALGRILAPYIGKFFSKMHTGAGMKMGVALAFALVFAWLASLVGLAPIVGAFAAGLLLDPVHFKGFKSASIVYDIRKVIAKVKGQEVEKEVEKVLHDHQHRHIEDLIEGLAYVFVPIFFVYTGMQVKLETIFDPKILGVALAVTVVAIFGKLACGLVVKKPVSKWIVGFGMVPRGEVGLIFANIGLALGVMSDELFSVVVIMVILTTLLTPPILNALLKREPEEKPVTA